jgi:hypothetical protein
MNFVYEAQNNFFSHSLEMSRPCWDLADLIKENKNEIRKYRLLIFSNSVIRTNIKKLNLILLMEFLLSVKFGTLNVYSICVRLIQAGM